METLPDDRRRAYAFGRYRLSADGTLLLREGARVALAPKVLQTLLVLVQRSGQVVRKADLLQAVWPNSFVEETGLTRNISLLRHALDDEAQAVVATVARVGYRFMAPVALVDDDGAAPPAAAGDGEPARQLTRLLILPFRLLRDDPETGFLAFSVPDAVVNALAGLDSLVVRSSAAASRFAGDTPDLPQIAAQASVDAVVTGTLVRSGDRIRMTAQLLAVPCGTIRWAESLEVPIRDVFELQDHLVVHVVRSLSPSLTAREQRRLRSDVPANAAAYEYFLRGNESVGPQAVMSAANLRVARDLYTRSVEADPRYAPAWARLGRCHYLIGKVDENRNQNFVRAESCFEKALELSPDLPLAHCVSAMFEIDRGRARSAMGRLIARALAGSAQPELYAAIVQACRFCGLLEPSVAAHARARALDPEIPTGGYQSLWHLGEDDRALREGIRPYLLQAIITGMRGDPEQALELLRALDTPQPTTLIRHLVAGVRAVFEGRPEAALENAEAIFEAQSDPEALYFAGRFVAYFGHPRALEAFGRALDGGFVVYRVLLKHDPWLDSIRHTSEFRRLVERSREAYRQCLTAYADAGGVRLLGPVPAPEELEGSAAGAGHAAGR